MPERTGLNAVVIGIYAVAGALLLLLLLVAVALQGGTAMGLVAVLACALGWCLSWLLARWFGGSPWLHGLVFFTETAATEIYTAAANDATMLRLRMTISRRLSGPRLYTSARGSYTI